MSTEPFDELMRRARTAEEMGRPETGIPFALRAVAMAPGDARALSTLAWLQQLGDRYGDSLRTANDAVAANPEYEWAHRLRGWALWRLGRPEAAADALAEAVRLEPTEVQALTRFAWFASLVGRGPEAFAAAERAVELGPRDEMSWFSLGWAAWALKRWAVAEDALRRARSLSPEQSNSHNNLGALLARRGRFDEALACFERALELDPRSPWSYRNAAYCLRSLGRWEEADALAERDALNKLHDANRQLDEGLSSPALAQRARALIMLDRIEEAEAVLEKAVELAEDADAMAMPLRDLASVKLMLGDDASARRLAERLLREYADDRYALSSVSKIGWFVGDTQLAARAAEAAATERFDPSVVAGCAANAALAEGDWSRAEHHILHKLELGRIAVAECCEHAQLGATHHYRGDAHRAASEIAEATRAEPRCWTLILLRDRLGISTQVPTSSA